MPPSFFSDPELTKLVPMHLSKAIFARSGYALMRSLIGDTSGLSLLVFILKIVIAVQNCATLALSRNANMQSLKEHAIGSQLFCYCRYALSVLPLAIFNGLQESVSN